MKVTTAQKAGLVPGRAKTRGTGNKSRDVACRPQESSLERRFRVLWESRYPHIELMSEYRFAPPRRYRADFCHEASRTLIELEGGIWNHGAHSRGAHFNSDAEKYNLAAANGFAVFRLTTNMLKESKHIDLIARHIEESE